ncbi:trypsin-like peptidase domain-containing protein [Paenalcaligenes niemegkensis]|uniref:trypsin-like peptidase domain-containing protein n=1 Tax=Paenalcaligenes niemegkensis TaxID=2895469 RepID=UPI001EE788A1|nr:trypsin-like peptidase domain-containing protein [Paenalcaligenes niemegkensis]MCQ9618117.1 trypsin-like peptidase domain-containing protein [Paenalcaligenes niemegkensis]
MRRFWLLFAQTATVCLGLLFIVSSLRPAWLANNAYDTATSEGASQSATMRRDDAVSSYADAVARAVPSVVNIYTAKHVNVPTGPQFDDPLLNRLFKDMPGFQERRRTTSLGSGVIVSTDGYILTNYHVVEAADDIDVALNDGRSARAELVGADPESDLAVLRIQLDKLKAIPVASAQSSLRVGDIVLAIGNPFGVGQTTTMGIISGLGRNRLGINIFENFIQTDAAINPGNSGGALVNAQGSLVGINTAIYSETGGSLGIGFAIPAQAALTILEQIRDTGAVTRGWLGVEPQDITDDLAEVFNLNTDNGVIIASLLRDGPAWKAGIRVGDIITSLNGAPLRDSVELLNRVAPVAPGEKVKLQVLREGKLTGIDVVVGSRPAVR